MYKLPVHPIDKESMGINRREVTGMTKPGRPPGGKTSAHQTDCQNLCEIVAQNTDTHIDCKKEELKICQKRFQKYVYGYQFLLRMCSLL